MPSNIIKKEPVLERRAQRQAARKNRQKQIYCRILIVCEGEKTEPDYFKKFKTIANSNFSYDVETYGGGLNTIGLVNKAIELRRKVQIPYDAVWAVFDKDDFPSHDFDNAITMAGVNNIGVAWSNEAFELWYLLHFQYRNTAMSRDDYKRAISDAVNAQKAPKDKKYVYRKNDEENYTIMTTYGSLDDAIRNATKLCEQFKGYEYHSYNPCTTVHKLVLQLLNRDNDLIAEVMGKIKNLR